MPSHRGDRDYFAHAAAFPSDYVEAKNGRPINWCIVGGIRSDDYHFYLQRVGGRLSIRAGCRHFTLEQANKHWGARYHRKDRKGQRLRKESRMLVSMMLHRAHSYKWLKKLPRWKA